MEIRKANIVEIDTLMELYAKARSFMAEHRNPHQWGSTYPEKSHIEQDILDGASYVCEEDGKVIGVFYFQVGPDKTYEKIYSGQWLSDAVPYGVVHRITSDGSVKGTASFCLAWAFEHCGNLRIDTHEDNQVMQNLLKKNGFTYCGVIHTEDGTERMAFQKVASSVNFSKQ